MGHHLTRKPYLHLLGKPILTHTIGAFDRNPAVDSIFVIVNPSDVDLCEAEAIAPYGFSKVEKLISGGDTRQDSVFNGLRSLPGETEFVIVHDGVRPFVTVDIIDDSLGAAAQYGAAVVAVPVNDTIKVVDNNGFIVDTPVRSELWAVQTPQSFRKDLLFEAHQHARRAGRHATDDAALVEQLGFRVKVIAGSRRNLKITTQEDLIFAEALSTVQD